MVLMDLVGVVNVSASVNVAQPTGREDESAVVTTYDWQEYFKDYCTSHGNQETPPPSV